MTAGYDLAMPSPRNTRPRPSARPARPRPSSLAGPEHQARVDREVSAAVAAVEKWHAADDMTDLELDLTDSCLAAVEAAERRASELGHASARAPGKRVVLRVGA